MAMQPDELTYSDLVEDGHGSMAALYTEGGGTKRRRQQMATLLLAVLLLSAAAALARSLGPQASGTVGPARGSLRSAGSLVGGLGSSRPADDHVQELCNALRDDAQSQLQGAGGWNGVFSKFQAVSVSKQVVAGMNYFVKVDVGDGQFVHLRIYEALPVKNAKPKLEAVKLVSENATLSYFEGS
eukprot:CAMPEP_0179101504 /NCGR_PEP_ID=MMETSP0796-20121207/46933_1 /TAXON_ID=73915 /ORGANISM="Pyrodinium bahamense, Strain pbaha01" /LENGTH=183 /DNA_ID=CAMNT_0020799355 /DNA_START=64 /DNA_END=615 /DNA_ORIENTATION=+